MRRMFPAWESRVGFTFLDLALNFGLILSSIQKKRLESLTLCATHVDCSVWGNGISQREPICHNNKLFTKYTAEVLGCSDRLSVDTALQWWGQITDSQSNQFYTAQYQKSQFASMGFTIFTQYHALCLYTLNSDKEILPKKNSGRATEQGSLLPETE